ncbi:MAG: hypothetical protein IPM80_24175 [Proteobacteria bacterium]|nr:hypothetical protein [Pseudomonadota bacterium]
MVAGLRDVGHFDLTLATPPRRAHLTRVPSADVCAFAHQHAAFRALDADTEAWWFRGNSRGHRFTPAAGVASTRMAAACRPCLR